MKNKFTITAVLIIQSLLFIAQNPGRVIIKNANVNNPQFIASLNGVRVANTYSSQVIFSFLEEQNYRVKILQSGSAKILNFNLTSDPEYVSIYVLNKDPYGNYALILQSKSLMGDEPVISAPTPAVPSTPTVATPTNTNPSNPRFPKAVKYELPPTSTETTPATPTATSVVINPISQTEFNERLESIKNTSFDKDKLAKAKLVFDGEYLYTNQVVEVVKVFSFDNFKLDYAKWAYAFTIDKKNYYKVQDQFSFSSSKNDLGAWLKKQPKE